MRRLVFAIGDIHGRLDLFEAALRAIADYGDGEHKTAVFLGDYVDRGPDAAGVIARLMRLSGSDFVCLKGNHEAMMVQALRTAPSQKLSFWLSNGGIETIESYGGAHRMPADHVNWLEDLPLWWADEHRDYVHAGVEPGVPIEDQGEATLLWIRERFLAASAQTLARHIVHGHTPRWREKPDASKPELLPHRTNLDTGAWMTGVLSVGVFDEAIAGGPIEVLSIR
jgi:serine/threonine protein phosphatase 1